MRETLVITDSNQVYWKGQVLGINKEMLVMLTDDQTINVCQDFVNKQREQIHQEHLVLTLSGGEDGYEVTLEPLGSSVNKIQGELPVALFIRYGRRLLLNDFIGVTQHLKEGFCTYFS